MQKIATLGAVSALLLGCSGSSTEIVLGDSFSLRVDEAPSGRTFVAMKLGLRACRPAKVGVVWGGPSPDDSRGPRAREACAWGPPVPA